MSSNKVVRARSLQEEKDLALAAEEQEKELMRIAKEESMRINTPNHRLHVIPPTFCQSDNSAEGHYLEYPRPRPAGNCMKALSRQLDRNDIEDLLDLCPSSDTLSPPSSVSGHEDSKFSESCQEEFKRSESFGESEEPFASSQEFSHMDYFAIVEANEQDTKQNICEQEDRLLALQYQEEEEAGAKCHNAPGKCKLVDGNAQLCN